MTRLDQKTFFVTNQNHIYQEGRSFPTPESLVDEAVKSISDSIIAGLNESETHSPFFSTDGANNPQYMIDYPVLIRSLVIPRVFNAFPRSHIEWRVEHIVFQSSGDTMTQIYINRGASENGWHQSNTSY